MQSLSLLVFFLFIWTSLQWCEKFKNKESNSIISVSHSADNFYLAVAVKDTSVKIYSLLTYKLLKTYTNAGLKPQKVRFSPDGKYLGIAYDSNQVKILNAFEPFNQNLTLTVSHNSRTDDLDFDSTGTLFMSCGNDNKLKIWTIVHAGTWTWLKQKSIAAQVQTSCRFSPTGTYIAHGTMNNAWVYTTASPTLTQTGTKGGKQFTEAIFSNDESRVYESTKDKKQLFKHDRTFATQNIILTSSDQLYTVDVSPNSKYIITGGKNKILYVYNQTNANHTMIYQMVFPDEINDAKFTRDSKKFSLGLKNSQFYVYTEDCLQFCESGYIYILVTKTCQKCSKIIANCSICQNSTYCKQCQVGFYQDKTTKLCSLCNIMEGCSMCSLHNQCTVCAPGYALNSSKLCEKCSKFLTGCNVCNSTSICVSCLNEYYLDTTSNTCKLCQLSTATSMSNCLRCNSSSVCIECMSGYFADSTNSNRCSKCSSNCLYCQNTASNCSQCTLGFYVNPPTSYTCTQCSYGCISCNATGFCFDCMAQMYQATDGTCQFCPFPCTSCENTTYCQKCIDHYFLNVTDNKCYRCENNCNTCNSSTYCVSCVEGYYLRTSDNTCQLCSTLKPYCTQCNSTQCLSCVKGFYYSTADTQCVKCISKMYQCVTCTSDTVCKQCAIGYFLTTNSGNASCATCPKQCQTCNSTLICTKCYLGFYLESSNNTCMSCQVDHCTQCTAKNQCIFCEVGYFLQASTKTCLICSTKGCYSCTEVSGLQQCELCLPGYYLDVTSKTCKQCNSSCTTCLTSATQCTSCAIGYYLDSSAKSCNLCPSSCSQCNDNVYCTSCSYGYYLDSLTNKCIHCTSKFNKSCIHCNATNCLLCKSGFYLTNTTVNTPPQICKGCNQTDIFCLECSATSCTKCSDGAYLDSSVTPQKCKTCSSSMQGCVRCSSSNTCTWCQTGYFLDGTMNKCKVCQVGCEQCSSSAVCTKCNSHYFLQPSNTSCVLCESLISGCSECPTNTKCQQCVNGFYLKNIDATQSKCEYCSQAISGCQYCNSSSICTKCLTQYYLDSTLVTGEYLCTKCATAMPGCELCVNASECIKCQSGYYLDGTSKLCKLCTVKLQGCVYCSSDGNTCKLCNNGHYLSLTTNKCVLCSSVQTGCQMCNQTSPGQFTCLKVRSGFYLKTVGTLKQSTICDALYCDVCLQSDPANCITCDSAFYLDSSSQKCIGCKSSMQACLTCSSSNTCTSCESGYFLDSNNKCSICTSKFDNCFLCTELSCKKCKSLYILDTSTSGCQTCNEKYPGCKYCNETNCFYCSSNYYKSGNDCITCDTISGCLACDNTGLCLKCKQNYYQDTVTKNCLLCSSFIEGCFACQSAGICVLCQSGYMVNENKTCTKMTASNSSAGQVKKSAIKLATEYVSKQLLKHSLYSSQYDFSKIDLNMNLSQIQLFMKYTANSLAIKQPLKLLSYEWSTSSSKLLYLYSNNPLNVSSNKMTMFRRLLQSPSSSISLEDTTVSVSIPQALAQVMLPQAKIVSDTEVKYDLSDSAFYASYIKQSNMQMWQFIVFGYIVIAFLLVNYTVRSFWTEKNTKSDHGEMILHYLSFAAPCLIIYPTTVQVLSFCYGFMLLNFPWMNDSLGRLLGNTFDNSPAVTKILYVNLNIGSTYAIALAVILLVIIVGYAVISICNNQRDTKPKEQNKSIFFNLVYNFFSYGAIFTSSLAIQGCFMNPINDILSFQNIANSLFYIVGILMLFLIFVDMFHSLCIDPTKYFYKLRNIIKTILLSLSHFNPTYFFSVLIIMDFLFVAGQYFISKSQNPKTFPFSWITKNIALNVGLIILVFFSNKMVSVIVSIALILLCVGLQIYQHCKLGSQKRSIDKLRFDLDNQYQRAADRTIHTEQNDDDKLRNKSKVWNIDTSPDVYAPQFTNTPIKDRRQVNSSRKQNTNRNQQNMTSIDTIFQSTEYEPRRRRDRKRQPIKNAVFSNLTGFGGMGKSTNEKVMHVKKRGRYDQADDNVERISDF